MLLDGYEAPPINHAAVLIEGNKIVKVGPASEIKIPADATVIDTSGLTMMPGMMEAHAHLAIIGHGEYRSLVRVARPAQGSIPAGDRVRDLGQTIAHGGGHLSHRPRRLDDTQPDGARSMREAKFRARGFR